LSLFWSGGVGGSRHCGGGGVYTAASGLLIHLSFHLHLRRRRHTIISHHRRRHGRQRGSKRDLQLTERG